MENPHTQDIKESKQYLDKSLDTIWNFHNSFVVLDNLLLLPTFGLIRFNTGREKPVFSDSGTQYSGWESLAPVMKEVIQIYYMPEC